jgi:hypothetical protein
LLLGESIALKLLLNLRPDTPDKSKHGFDVERHIAMASDDNHGFPLRLKM